MKPRIRSILLLALGLLLAGGAVYLSPLNARRGIRLTPAERRWLGEHGQTIRIAPLPDSPPIEFFGRDGRHLGLTADYFDLIERRLGIRFVRVRCDSWKEILGKLETREVDLVGSVQDTPERRRFLRFTKPYQHIPNVILMRKDGGSPAGGMRVAVVSDSATQGYLETHRPEYRLVPVRDAAEGLHMLSFGEVDAMVADLGVASYYIEKLGISNLRAAEGIDYPWNLCLASRRDWPLLNSILDKTLADITPRQRRAIRRKWITLDDTAIVPRGRYLKVIGAILLLGLLVTGSIVFWNRTLQRQVRRRTGELLALRNLLGSIVDSMPSTLIGVDADGLVTLWNREAARITGVPEDAARGKEFKAVFPNLGSEMARALQTVPARRMQHCEQIPCSIGDRPRHANVTVYPITTDGAGGSVIRIDDVTERVLFEEAMTQSEKMVSVGRLAAGMAHEINNPLAGILQNLQVLRNRLATPSDRNEAAAEKAGASFESVRRYAEERDLPKIMDSIAEAGRRASKIVGNMLGFSRKDGGRFEPHALEELLERSLELAASEYSPERRFGFRQIRIVREYDASLPPVACEAGQIQQVVLNLLSNGAQALADAPPEEPRITLRLRREDGMARIEIEDNGPGMDAETRRRVFEPFFTTKGVGHGTGLGLSVSYFIVTETHRGTMGVRSALGRGTCFTIRIPIRPQAEKERSPRLERFHGPES